VDWIFTTGKKNAGQMARIEDKKLISYLFYQLFS